MLLEDRGMDAARLEDNACQLQREREQLLMQGDGFEPWDGEAVDRRRVQSELEFLRLSNQEFESGHVTVPDFWHREMAVGICISLIINGLNICHILINDS